MSHPPHIARLTRGFESPIEPPHLERGWSIVRARPTEAVAKAVADAFAGEIDEVGNEYEAVKALGQPPGGGVIVNDASLALVQDEAIIGVCLVQTFDGVPEISWLCTSKSTRHRGVATMLLGSSLGALDRAGHSHVVLFVSRANQAALGLYQRFGFVKSQGTTDAAPG